MKACSRVENAKPSGLDRIPNIAPKAIVKAALALFPEAYNYSLKVAYVSAEMEEKTTCVGKMLERIRY